MIPTVILDTNSLFGTKLFTKADNILLFSLSKSKHIRLIVPEVVLLELARQWEETTQKTTQSVKSGLDKLTLLRSDAGLKTKPYQVPLHSQSQFVSFAREHLASMTVEIVDVPNPTIKELLEKDLAGHKPFSRTGKGFRDALIWKNVTDICAKLPEVASTVLFTTSNSDDFCDSSKTRLDPHLKAEIPDHLDFQVVDSIENLLKSTTIKPSVDMLRVLDETLTREHVAQLVDNAVSELVGSDVIATVGYYEGSGMFASPFDLAVDGATFDEIAVDDGSIEWGVFRTGDTLTIRVAASADCSFDGYVDKGEYFNNDSAVSILEDWNAHMFRASQRTEGQFTFSAEFTAETLEEIVLTVEDVEQL